MELKKESVTNYFKYSRSGYETICLTKTGGYSSGSYDSLNLSYAVGDDKSDVDKNFVAVLAQFDLQEGSLVRLNQVHGDDILLIREGASSVLTGDYDAVVTDDGNLALSIMTADCVPLFLFDPVTEVFAAVHAGWRGTAKGIAGKAVRVMLREFLCDPKRIRAVIGPSIGKCCYEVSSDVAESLGASVRAGKGALVNVTDGKARVDLKGFNAEQLIESGLRPDMITSAEECTSCRSDLFYSYRRDNITGRQLSFIAKQK